ARENGQGMVFELEPSSPPPDDGPGEDDTAPSRPEPGRPALKVAK
ncbi:MAG: ClpXP protease specificity-enhancing factor, partial [Pseudomonadota bacterium]|nr:ClpXP protease specificity-enhancing factor [Pseudomonadota bacterium]